ncbi:Septin-type guanine nucleotide-binding (G) domain-containing protein, partial [Chlamydoabsidia padenii]
LDALPYQHYLKAKRTPIRLNVMIVGESGLGKKTFINSLFQTDIFDDHHDVDLDQQSNQNVTIHPITCMLEEEGVKMLLTVIETRGFGDRFDRTRDLDPILQYINDQYKVYFEAESGFEFRKNRSLQDTRVHLCFYFISPGHCLKELDIVSLQALSQKVNVLPLIARADSLTDREKAVFKKQVLEDLPTYNIRVYPNDYPNKDRMDLNFEKYIPFCIVCSNDMVTVDGKQVRGREYSFGKVQVEHPHHSDFMKLRQLLMEHLLHELGDITHDFHYQIFRTQYLM